VYKEIGKMLANRLKVVLLEVISEGQSAFVPRHLSINRILMAYEIIHASK
jgi:hypothetical protein